MSVIFSLCEALRVSEIITPAISVLNRKLFYYNNRPRKALAIGGQDVVSHGDDMGTQRLPVKI